MPSSIRWANVSASSGTPTSERGRPNFLKKVTSFLRLAAEWESQDPDSVAPSLEKTSISLEDAQEAAQYYAPFDAELKAILGSAALLWEAKRDGDCPDAPSGH